MMVLSLEISLVHRGKYVRHLSPFSPSVGCSVFALYDRNTRILAFLISVISLSLLNTAFWMSMGIQNMRFSGPCIMENPPFTAVYLA